MTSTSGHEQAGSHHAGPGGWAGEPRRGSERRSRARFATAPTGERTVGAGAAPGRPAAATLPGRADAAGRVIDAGRWEDAVLAALGEMPGPARPGVVATHACEKLWPDDDREQPARMTAATEAHAAQTLDALARRSRIHRWAPGERYPSDLWSRAGWSWETCDEPLYATVEHARLWCANAEWDDRERQRAAELARRVAAVTGWSDVSVSPSEPALVAVRLSVTEAEELLARIAR